jgi:flagellar hook-associated protein 3 FlgL
MRVTNNSTINNLIKEINKNRTQWADFQRQVSSQVRVERPSDDPLAYSSGNESKSVLEQNKQYQKNIDSGLDQSRYAQDMMDEMVNRLVELKQVATYGANGSALTDSDMETLADNVASLRTQLVDLGNSDYQGRKLFGGTKTTTQPFQDSGGTLSYEGNNKSISVKINGRTSIDISVTGEDLFAYSSESVFDLLDRVEQNLRAGDASAVNADLDNITDATEYVASKTSKLANNINRMEYVYNQYENNNLTLSEKISRELDTDFAEAITNLQQLDTAYQAALSTTARIGNLSLANYL